MSEQEVQQPEFQIQRIYIKDLSFESPHSPEIFLEEWQPEVDLEVEHQMQQVDDTTYEVGLKITVTVKNNDKSAFIAELHQAGLFHIAGVEGVHFEHAIKGVCPNILFPYARETISDMVARGTFPQFLLQPINFEAAFVEELQRQQAEEEQQQH